MLLAAIIIVNILILLLVIIISDKESHNGLAMCMNDDAQEKSKFLIEL